MYVLDNAGSDLAFVYLDQHTQKHVERNYWVLPGKDEVILSIDQETLPTRVVEIMSEKEAAQQVYDIVVVDKQPVLSIHITNEWIDLATTYSSSLNKPPEIVWGIIRSNINMGVQL